MLWAGITQNGAARLWKAVHRRNPRLKLFGPDGVAEPAFSRRLSRGAAKRTLLTDPALDPAAYPPAAQGFYAAFRARFGKEPEPYAIQGYEAMSVVLDDPPRWRRSRGGHRGLPRDPRPRFRARALLGRRERRHDALDLRRAADRPAGPAALRPDDRQRG
jgi:hypothetical protein